jgi:hypothetical protein
LLRISPTPLNKYIETKLEIKKIKENIENQPEKGSHFAFYDDPEIYFETIHSFLKDVEVSAFNEKKGALTQW